MSAIFPTDSAFIGNVANRRRSARRVLAGSQEICAVELEPGNHGFVHDVCADGIGLETSGAVAARNFFRLELRLPNTKPVVVGGELAWNNGNRAGIHLLRYEGAARQILKEFAHRPMPLPGASFEIIKRARAEERAAAERKRRIARLVRHVVAALIVAAIGVALWFVPWLRLLSGPTTVLPYAGDVVGDTSGTPSAENSSKETGRRRNPRTSSSTSRRTNGSRNPGALGSIGAGVIPNLPLDPNAPRPRASVQTARGLGGMHSGGGQVFVSVHFGEPRSDVGVTYAPEELIEKRVLPEYPPEAQRQRLQGQVELEIAIARDGNVRNIGVVSGPQPLVTAAVEAVRHWRFRRGLREGAVIPVVIDFQLPD